MQVFGKLLKSACLRTPTDCGASPARLPITLLHGQPALLIDSDVLIDVTRRNQAAGDYLVALTEGWSISQVSALELIVGARDKADVANIDSFLSGYVIVPLRESTGAKAYQLLKLYAKSHGVPGAVDGRGQSARKDLADTLGTYA